MPEYHTVTGLHLLGSSESPSDIQALMLDGWRFRVCKVVSDAGQSVRIASALPTGTVLIHRWYRHNNFYSDRMGDWTGDTPAVAALGVFNALRPELDKLATISHLKVLFETFNEQGQSNWYADFCVALSRLVYQQYGNRLAVAAFSSSSGSYNDPEHWAIFARYVRGMFDLGLDPHICVHAYASWRSWAWNGKGRQKVEIQALWNMGATFDEETILPASILDDPEEPPTYTGHGYIRLLWGLQNIYGIDLSRVSLWINECSIDDMGDPGIGQHHRGWIPWSVAGTWDRFPGDHETQAGDQLWYNERQYRNIATRLKDMGAAPFTLSDQNRDSDWHREFRLMGGPYNQLKYRARNTPAEPIPELPSLDNLDYCAVATLTTTPVNIRQQPTATSSTIKQMNPLVIYRVDAQTVNAAGETWLHIMYELNTFAWVAKTWRNATGDLLPITRTNCDKLPEWKGEKPVSKFTPIQFDPTGVIIQDAVQKFHPPMIAAVGDPNVGDALAANNQDGILQWWFNWTAGVGEGDFDYGNLDTFMDKMRGQPVPAMVTAWYEDATNKNAVNAIRQKTFKDNQATGEQPVIDNPFYNPHVYIQILNGDTVPADMRDEFLEFSAKTAKRLWDGFIVSNWHLDYRLHTALVNMDISQLDQRAFWQLAETRGLISAAIDTGSVIVLNRRIFGRFQDYKKSEIFPVETFAVLNEMQRLDQLKFFLRFEYADGWRSQGISAADVLRDMYLLEYTSQEFAQVAGWGLMLQRNPDKGDDAQWKKDSDITELLSTFFDVLNVGGKPAVAWQSEDSDLPAPVAAIIGPTSAVVGQEILLSAAPVAEGVTLRWEYLSGSTAIGESLIVSFDQPGSYTVTLTATGPGGSDSASRIIEVSAAPEPPPEPIPEPPESPAWGLSDLTAWILGGITFMLGTITGAAIVLITLWLG